MARHERTIPSFRFWFAVSLLVLEMPCSYRAFGLLTELLNISLLACAATPPLTAGALERRAATPLTLSLSEKVAICVSMVLCTSRAVGGTMVELSVEGAGRVFGE